MGALMLKICFLFGFFLLGSLWNLFSSDEGLERSKRRGEESEFLGSSVALIAEMRRLVGRQRAGALMQKICSFFSDFLPSWVIHCRAWFAVMRERWEGECVGRFGDLMLR